jgi:hypothetical protein
LSDEFISDDVEQRFNVIVMKSGSFLKMAKFMLRCERLGFLCSHLSHSFCV